MATLTFSGIPSGIVQTSMDNVTYTEATSPITLVDGMYIWVSSSWQLIGQPVTYVNSVYVNENQNDVWSNSRESPFILTHGGTLNYTTSSTQTATSAFIAKYVEQPKTTLDLSTLSDIADGAHTVKVKAKADGYIDSEFSNEVSYTKAPAGYSVIINPPPEYPSGTSQDNFAIYYYLDDSPYWNILSGEQTVNTSTLNIKVTYSAITTGFHYDYFRFRIELNGNNVYQYDFSPRYSKTVESGVININSPSTLNIRIWGYNSE